VERQCIGIGSKIEKRRPATTPDRVRVSQPNPDQLQRPLPALDLSTI